MFPRPTVTFDEGTEDEYSYYIDGYELINNPEFGYDEDLAAVINEMDPRSQEYATEMCLEEFLHYEFEGSEGTTTFCCQAIIGPEGNEYYELMANYLVKAEEVEDAPEGDLIYNYYSEEYGDAEYGPLTFSAEVVDTYTAPEESEDEDDEEEAAIAKGAVSLASFAAMLSML